MTAEEATVASTEKALEAAEEKKSLKSNPEDPSSAGVGFWFPTFLLQFQLLLKKFWFEKKTYPFSSRWEFETELTLDFKIL